MTLKVQHPSTTGLLRSEAGKITTQRGHLVLITAAVLIGPLASLMLLISLPVTQGEPLARTPPFEVLTAGLLGVDAMTIAVIVLAASIIGTEYTSGMMQQSLLVTPARLHLLTVKVVIAALTCVTVGALSLGLIVTVASCALWSTGRGASSLVTAAGLQAIAGTLAMPVFYGLLAALIAFAARSTAIGILGPLVILLSSGLLRWLGPGIEQLLVPISPLAGLHSISGSASAVEDIGPLAGACVLGAWLLIGYGIAVWRFTRKDA